MFIFPQLSVSGGGCRSASVPSKYDLFILSTVWWCLRWAVCGRSCLCAHILQKFCVFFALIQFKYENGQSEKIEYVNMCSRCGSHWMFALSFDGQRCGSQLRRRTDRLHSIAIQRRGYNVYFCAVPTHGSYLFGCMSGRMCIQFAMHVRLVEIVKRFSSTEHELQRCIVKTVL